MKCREDFHHTGWASLIQKDKTQMSQTPKLFVALVTWVEYSSSDLTLHVAIKCRCTESIVQNYLQIICRWCIWNLTELHLYSCTSSPKYLTYMCKYPQIQRPETLLATGILNEGHSTCIQNLVFFSTDPGYTFIILNTLWSDR